MSNKNPIKAESHVKLTHKRDDRTSEEYSSNSRKSVYGTGKWETSPPQR